ncbi:DUF3431 domain-containing protein [Spirosoma endbachense]|uniref:DUF3431 domain-containing protein n=1 Tax=Spirosoma endbachense TaxID=2666025 RepID=A0A6P1W2W5_9BACT|nr:DUF3431 domain-containing protein [Spirosoma endbachense]QHV98347.1 DUF3431 domain-containing protein [Spirosoma endbachense]
MLELVVAHYTENLNWLRNLPAGIRLTVYDKSPDQSAGSDAILLPNIGREAHTYLYHIVSRYDSLADWTLFAQGKPFDHAFDFKKTVKSFVDKSGDVNDPVQKPFHWLGHLIDTDDNRGERLFQPWSKNEDGRGLDLRGFHQALFDTAGPALYTFVLGAQFAIHRDAIRQQSLAFYERALAVSITFPDAAHCFERSWDRVFGLIGIDPDWLAGRQTVYLKPMKHQLPAKS